MAEELGEKNQKVLFAQEGLDRLRHMKFGRSSERQEGDGPLFSQFSENCEAPAQGPTKPPRKRSSNGRRPQPELPVQDVSHTIDPDDVKKCGLRLWQGQFETSEQITVVPSQIILERHHRQKYFQDNAETGEPTIVTAPGPLKLKEGGRYSIEFGVEVGLAKYQWHLPLARQVKMLLEHGLDI